MKTILLTLALLSLQAGSVLANDQEVSTEAKIEDILDLSKKPIYTPADQFGGRGYNLLTNPWGHPDELLGYRYQFPLTTRSILRYEDEIIFDKTYNIIAGLKLFVPQSAENHPKGRITLMGCSFVFGIGLNDDETLMARLSELRPKYEIDNLALIGSGPNTILAYLEELNYSPPVQGEEDIYIYVFSEAEHVTRANGFMIPLEWAGGTPHYQLTQNGSERTMKRNGSLTSAQPIRAQILKWLRQYVSIPLGLSFDFPPILDSHREYVCNLFEHMDKVIKGHNPKAKFYIFHYPFNSPGVFDYYSDCLAKRKISVLPLKNLKSIGNLHPYDSHPNEEGAKILAETLNEALKKLN